MIHIRQAQVALFASLLVTPYLRGQESSSRPDRIQQQQDAEKEKEQSKRHYSFGGRVEYYPFRLFQTKNAAASTSSPIADYTYLGSSHSTKAVLGASGEYRLNRHVAFGAELFRHEAQYSQVTQIRSGKKDPNSSTDNRQVTTLTQTTRANYWELPVLARYYGAGRAGFLKHMYVAGGMSYRHIGNIRTSNETANADGSTAYNETPATSDRTNQLGFVTGVGVRFIDDFMLRVTPEIRFTRWLGSTFHGQAYNSSGNQLEAGMAIIF